MTLLFLSMTLHFLGFLSILSIFIRWKCVCEIWELEKRANEKKVEREKIGRRWREAEVGAPSYIKEGIDTHNTHESCDTTRERVFPATKNKTNRTNPRTPSPAFSSSSLLLFFPFDRVTDQLLLPTSSSSSSTNTNTECWNKWEETTRRCATRAKVVYQRVRWGVTSHC